MQKKILSISLLVSGREATTEKCLDSLRGLLEQLDSELILVDTGCSGDLRKKLEQYTDRIISFTWCNDFAKARNAGLQQACGEWFLFLDDDEWFEDVGPIVDFFQSGEYREYEQAVYKARNYSNRDGSSYSEEWVSRMIHLREDTHFEGRLHEALMPTIGKCKKIDAFVHHFGYAYENEEERQAHFKRNVSILEPLMKEEPDNMRWWIQILPEYIGIKDCKRLRSAAKEALRKIHKVDKSFMNQCRGAFYSAVLTSFYMEEDYAAMEEWCRLYCADARNSQMTQCSLYALGAAGASMRNNPKDMEAYAEAYFQALSNYQMEEKTEQEQIIEESIIMVKDAVSEQKQQEMRLFWAQALAKQKKPEEFPEEERIRLQSYVEEQLAGNGEFLVLPELYWELSKANVLPLENILLELPLSQWMVQVGVLEQKNDIKIWGGIREHLMDLRTKEDIRYTYFFMHDANNLLMNSSMAEICNELDFETMTEFFQYFTESNLKYARSVYTQKAFEGKMEVLPESCRGAVWMEKMLTREEEDWNIRMEYLVKSVREYPVIGDLVKRYAHLIGERQEEQNQKAKEAADEMQVMAVQIKKQISTLMAAGMYAEAYEVVKQLRAMLPRDEELKILEQELEERFS